MIRDLGRLVAGHARGSRITVVINEAKARLQRLLAEKSAGVGRYARPEQPHGADEAGGGRPGAGGTQRRGDDPDVPDLAETREDNPEGPDRDAHPWNHTAEPGLDVGHPPVSSPAAELLCGSTISGENFAGISIPAKLPKIRLRGHQDALLVPGIATLTVTEFVAEKKEGVESPFERIHMDGKTVEQLPEEIPTQYKGIIVLIDKYSHTIGAYSVESDPHAIECLRKFKSLHAPHVADRTAFEQSNCTVPATSSRLFLCLTPQLSRRLVQSPRSPLALQDRSSCSHLQASA